MLVPRYKPLWHCSASWGSPYCNPINRANAVDLSAPSRPFSGEAGILNGIASSADMTSGYVSRFSWRLAVVGFARRRFSVQPHVAAAAS